jgi:hypothetical protein
VIGLVTITALIGYGGYGVFINDGLNRQLLDAHRARRRSSRSCSQSSSTCSSCWLERLLTPWRRAGADGSGLMGAVGDVWGFLTTADNWTGSRGILAARSRPCVDLARGHGARGRHRNPSRRLARAPPALPVLSVAVVNIGRAIPSFAIIALVFPISIRYGFGLGFWPTCVALVALGIPPMFTNTYAGVAGHVARAASRPPAGSA